MRTCGIIAEYNPFHNGHAYQLSLLKKKYDAVVVVMSGGFTERGDVAIIDKWTRAKCALISGADLVLELPVVYAMNTAERFAYGAVSVFCSLGIVEALSFGSECGDIKALTDAAYALADEKTQIKETILSIMNGGTPYAAARTQAYKGIIDENLLNMPNNILAVEYIKQLILQKSEITPITHKRLGGYSDLSLEDSKFASATAIREARTATESIKHFLPKDCYELYEKADKHFLENLSNTAAYFIRTTGLSAMPQTLECTEGLENRIFDAAARYTDIEKIAEFACSKRYTRAKIRRIILSSMLGITRELCFIRPNYIRVLGATDTGRILLGDVKSRESTGIITKTADYKMNNILFEKDILSTDIYALSAEGIKAKRSGEDYYTSPLML